MTVGIKQITVRLLWEPKPNRKPLFFLQNLPKPTEGKIFETVTTLYSKVISSPIYNGGWQMTTDS